MTNFHIKIISDTVCPFCYLGKVRLEKAIALYQKTVPGGSSDTFNVDWRAFQLDPTLSKTPVPVKERLAQRFGADRLEAMNQRLSRMGRGDGINFTSEGMIGNTRDSHRLVQFVKSKDSAAESRVMSILMRKYFEEGGDITSHQMLAAAGEEAGFDRAEVERYLASDDGGAEVEREYQEAVVRGIRGVPHFVINDKFEVDGAQDVPTFLEALTEAKGTAVAF